MLEWRNGRNHPPTEVWLPVNASWVAAYRGPLDEYRNWRDGCCSGHCSLKFERRGEGVAPAARYAARLIPAGGIRHRDYRRLRAAAHPSPQRANRPAPNAGAAKAAAAADGRGGRGRRAPALGAAASAAAAGRVHAGVRDAALCAGGSVEPDPLALHRARRSFARERDRAARR
ncbi:hypothetical protein [Paenibacillus sp. UNC451MF]|uniref:hypothetical protein n=1 Tax=Paenibacillus sp. UNC451MF TaxID=1449063 RepID=UPI0018CBF82E|nr:hypothetical protein [Paenibacillus sp. UNC451MF]